MGALTAAAFALASTACSTEPPPAEPIEVGPVAAPSPSVTSTRLPVVLYEDFKIAQIDLSRLGLHSRVKLRITVQWPPDTIVAQSPQAGSLVTPGATVTLTVSAAPACEPAYPTICLPPFHFVHCRDIQYRGFRVLPPDPYHLDRNGDGIGCLDEGGRKSGG